MNLIKMLWLSLIMTFCEFSEILAEGNRDDEEVTSEEDFTNNPDFSLRSSDFSRIVRTTAFVDKSAFIKNFIEDQTIVVITAPNHFGKSTNLDMLKRFLEIEVDNKGNRKTKVSSFHYPVRDTDNYRLFVDNNLNIAKDQAFMDRYFGKHPVIHVDMDFNKHDVMSYDVAAEGMKFIIHYSYLDHEYLERSDRLSPEDKAKIKSWCSTTEYLQMSESDTIDSLQLLSRYLYLHYDNSPVYVLIDNFDSPDLNSIMFTETEDVMGGVYRLVSSIILKVLQDNVHVCRGFISGMSYIAGSPSLYGLHGFRAYRFLEDHSYSGFHGLTQTEASDLFSPHRFHLSADVIARMAARYGGYKTMSGNLSLYNPWSVYHSLLYKDVQDYWDGPEIPLNLLRVPTLRTEINALHDGRNRKVKLKNIYAPDDVIRLRDLIRQPKFHQELHYADTVLSWLLEFGYLSYKQTPQNFTGGHLARVPNTEMRRRILDTIHKYNRYYSIIDAEEYPHKRHFKYRT